MDLREQVESSLDEIRPRLQADGGDVELVDITDEGIVQLRLQGACRGCPGAIFTLKIGIEQVLKEKIPSIQGVEAV